MPAPFTSETPLAFLDNMKLALHFPSAKIAVIHARRVSRLERKADRPKVEGLVR
jgi:hypothetical protein